jgi:hypothetical protein
MAACWFAIKPKWPVSTSLQSSANCQVTGRYPLPPTSPRTALGYEPVCRANIANIPLSWPVLREFVHKSVYKGMRAGASYVCCPSCLHQERVASLWPRLIFRCIKQLMDNEPATKPTIETVLERKEPMRYAHINISKADSQQQHVIELPDNAAPTASYPTSMNLSQNPRNRSR